MDYLSICAIVKDENDYLPEWVHYHKLIGVERFYIYDNGSAVPIRKTLEKEIASGLVIVFDFLGPAMQIEAYMNCVQRLRGVCNWIAFIDIDEFICLKKGSDLREFLRPYQAYGGLVANWQTFGPSGHQVRPKGLQLENFLMRGPVDFDWNQHVKTIARPECVHWFPCCHYGWYVAGAYAVNERGVGVREAFSVPISVEGIQINHYFTRSREEYLQKMVRGAGDGSTKKMNFYELIEKECSSVRDESLLKYADQVRAALEARG